jgi:hypothetical protein
MAFGERQRIGPGHKYDSWPTPACRTFAAIGLKAR